MIEWTNANPGQIQWSFQGEPVKVSRLEQEWPYFMFFVNQLAMIKKAAATNGWDISALSDRDIHLQVWRTRSDEAAIKKMAEYLASSEGEAAER